MPPKIVYGKKKSTARQQTNFATFLSPEKVGVLVENESQSANTAVRVDWRQQLEDAARKPGKGTKEGEDVALLAKGLDGLRIEQTRSTEEEVSKEKGSKSRKGRQKCKTSDRKEDGISVDDALELDMKSLSIDCPAQEETVQRKKPSRTRKALANRSANAIREADCKPRTTQKKQKRVSLECIEAKTASDAPVWTRKSRDRANSKTVPLQQKLELPTPEPTPEPEDIYSVYASPLLMLSDRRKIVAFEDWSVELEPHFEITKIAEASFSEVYRLSASSKMHGVREESVLKVVALKTPPNVPLPSQLHSRTIRDRDGQLANEMAEREEKDQWKSDVADVLSEVKLLQNLNHIPGFTVFRDMTIVQGRPSSSFNDAWKNWNKSRPRGKKSEFPDPSKKTSYDDTQLWAVVEMQDAGTDCEKMMELGGLSSIWEVWDVFWGVCSSIAKAEEACRFEHRDLHLGNICVRSSRMENALQPQIKDPLRQKLRFTGLETTVIDYTLSRADNVSAPSRRSSTLSSVSNSTTSSDLASSVTDVAYLDLDKDAALFEGDASEEYQYEIYRYMRGAALYNNPLQSNPTVTAENLTTPRRSPRKNTHIRFDEDDAIRHSPRKTAQHQTDGMVKKATKVNEDVWRAFHPKTNLVWAHFLLHKLLNHLRNHKGTPDQLSTKDIMHNVIVDGEAAEQQKIKKKAMSLYKVLQKVSERLCPVALGRDDGLSSMKELVVLALEERWLRVGDVAG
ncbi:Nn.00g003230.m01.CDS01 [Neocucurbitaria sp. VM-36]